MKFRVGDQVLVHGRHQAVVTELLADGRYVVVYPDGEMVAYLEGELTLRLDLVQPKRAPSEVVVKFRKGDRVLVNGRHQGVVRDSVLSSGMYLVVFQDGSTGQYLEDELTFRVELQLKPFIPHEPSEVVVKTFDLGDRVRVIAGRRQDQTGVVDFPSKTPEVDTWVKFSDGVSEILPTCWIELQPDLPYVYVPSPAAPPVRAMRSNSNKPELRYMFCFSRAQRGISAVSTAGAIKYDLYDFMKGAPGSQSLDCAMRHLDKWWNGEDIDGDDPVTGAKGTGQNHLFCAAWNMMRAAHELTGPMASALDDRPHKVLERRAEAEKAALVPDGEAVAAGAEPARKSES